MLDYRNISDGIFIVRFANKAHGFRTTTGMRVYKKYSVHVVVSYFSSCFCLITQCLFLIKTAEYMSVCHVNRRLGWWLDFFFAVVGLTCCQQPLRLISLS